MKNVLFATTATAALLIGGIASAQGIALFGDARLGLGYNINNDGVVLHRDQRRRLIDTPDDLRAVSRVRFGVNMTGETDSGITFGATIRADNADRRPGRRPRRPDRRLGLRVGQLGHPDLRRHQRRRRAVGRRRPGRLLAHRPRRPRRDPVHLERRRLRQRQRQQLRREPGRPSDGPLRLRHHGLRPVAVVEPRPDRHRRRHRLRGRLRRRQLERRRRLQQVRRVRSSIGDVGSRRRSIRSPATSIDRPGAPIETAVPGRRAVVGRPEGRPTTPSASA